MSIISKRERNHFSSTVPNPKKSLIHFTETTPFTGSSSLGNCTRLYTKQTEPHVVVRTVTVRVCNCDSPSTNGVSFVTEKIFKLN